MDFVSYKFTIYLDDEYIYDENNQSGNKLIEKLQLIVSHVSSRAISLLISSGNETSPHTLENGRITFMFCSFKGTPNILRLYGKGFIILPGSKEWDMYVPQFKIHASTRQIIAADISMVQTSCGFGVPLFTYQGERDIHFEWAEKQGEKRLREYVQEKNLVSLDGLPPSIGLKENGN